MVKTTESPKAFSKVEKIAREALKVYLKASEWVQRKASTHEKKSVPASVSQKDEVTAA